jgi:hypothetical protein
MKLPENPITHPESTYQEGKMDGFEQGKYTTLKAVRDYLKKHIDPSPNSEPIYYHFYMKAEEWKELNRLVDDK